MLLNDIHSNNKPICARCGCIIMPITDSGWEIFTDDGITTQPICILCHLSDKNTTEKAVNNNTNKVII